MVKAKVSDDEELVTEIREKIKENQGYCACAIKRVPDVKCPCSNFREMLKAAKIGETCHCGLYEIIEIPENK